MANVVSNLFEKLKMANTEKALRQQELADLQNALNPTQIATPEQANLLAQNLKNIGVAQIPTIQQEKKFNLFDRMKENALGKQITTPVETSIGNDENGNPVLKTGTANDLRRGGLLPDIFNGARENFNTRFDFSNLDDNMTPDGRKKGVAYRFGEALGSVGRFLDSPAGKMLLAYGASNMLGDTNPLEQAFTAGATNYNLKAQDRMYRDDLIKTQQNYLRNSADWNNLSDAEKEQILSNVQGREGFSNLAPEEQQKVYGEALDYYLANRQQKQLEDVANQINSQRGFITGDMYNNYIRSQQLRDNADYRNMMLDYQRINNDENRKLREVQLQQQKEQQDFNRYIQKANLDDKRAARADSNYWRGLDYGLKVQDRQDKLSKLANKEDYKDVQDQLNAFEKTFEKANNPYRYRTAGWASEKMNTLTKEEANFNAQRTLLFNQIARKLGGEKGVLSDADIKRVEAALPSLSDTYNQKQAKMKAIYQLLDIKKGGNGGGATTVGKYKVTVK